MTSRSSHLIEEYKNYLWETDRITGKVMNTPIDDFNHCLDAARYSFDGLRDSAMFEVQRSTLRSLQQAALAGEL